MKTADSEGQNQREAFFRDVHFEIQFLKSLLDFLFSRHTRLVKVNYILLSIHLHVVA